MEWPPPGREEEVLSAQRPGAHMHWGVIMGFVRETPLWCLGKASREYACSLPSSQLLWADSPVFFPRRGAGMCGSVFLWEERGPRS